MKRLIALLLAAITLLLIPGCSTESIPSEVSEYARKHDIELLSVDKLIASAVVGKDYVVYGTISHISFYNYEKGSSDLEKVLSNVDERVKDIMEARYEGTMCYYVSLSGAVWSLEYEDWNFMPKMKINKGDEVAFIITCEDGYSPGTYDYVIKQKIWENRHSDTTIEEDHDNQES